MLNEAQLLKNEEDGFMSEDQLTSIHQLLIDMRNKVIAQETLVDLYTEPSQSSDDADRAQVESAWMMAIKKRSLDNDLLSDIEKGLHKMNIGEYGYCERSGEPLAIARLLASPTSRMTLEEQTRYEYEQQTQRSSEHGHK